MKLTCHLEIRNPLVSTPVKKLSACTLALCKDTKNAPVILACTKQNVAGDKYEVKNLKKIFSKFVVQGKATLSFDAPPHDLLIKKADPLQLRSFLHFLVKGESSNLRFSAPPTRIETPSAKKLVVTRRSDIPVPLPRTLEQLSLLSLGLVTIPKSAWQLDRLTKLEINSNAIASLPTELSRLTNLVILNFEGNVLTNVNRFPMLISLRELNLSRNRLTSLSESICDLPSLTHLSVQNNFLSKLPNGIGKLRKLRYLRASSNVIEVLPSSFMQLRLESLDLNGNPLNRMITLNQELPLSVPTLLEWAAETTLHYRLPFSAETIPYTLVDYLTNETSFCALCLKPVLTSAETICQFDIRRVAEVTISIDNNRRTDAPISVNKCLKHSQEK